MKNKTFIKTVHEEEYSDGRILGVLINHVFKDSGCEIEIINSFTYLFREESQMYIFFETIVDLNDYLLYGDNKVKKAYLKEEKFDEFYDNKIEGNFNDTLKWV